MKLEKPVNTNYCATVVTIKNIVPLENCDNLAGTTIFGYQAVVNKTTQIGQIGIVFPAETQLSDEYCFENNLYRHDDKNRVHGVKGYIEDTRRVKAVKFRGNRSDCLFMPLESLEYTGIKVSDLKEGDEFDQLNGKEICKKYEVKASRSGQQQQVKRASRVEKKFMPEHYDTENYFKWSPTLDPETNIIVTQKIHGTSVRIANTVVNRRLNLFEKLLRKLGVKIKETEFDYIYGSRRVIKDPNNPNQIHFYERDIWTEQGKKLIGLIPQGFIVYAELIGWTSEQKPIQVGYTYGIPEGQAQMYIYRVAFVNSEGRIQDLSWDHMVEFCKERGLQTVTELWRGKLKDFKVEKYLDVRFSEMFKTTPPIWLGNNDLVDEGVCVRVDKMVPYFLKAKSPKFLEHETKLLDEGQADMESDQSV